MDSGCGMSTDSLFLCGRPCFLEGVSRILDFGNSLNEYNRSLTPDQADRLAIGADWRLIGVDSAHARLARLAALG